MLILRYTACGIKRGKKADSSEYEVFDVISIAGELKNLGGGNLDPKLTRLKTSESTSDSQKEGVRISLYGGRHQLVKGGREQRAIVEMVCSKTLKGTEGEWNPEDDKYEQVPPERRRRDEEGGGDKGDDKKDDTKERQLLKTDVNATALVFDSYGPMADAADVDVLRLTWHTEFACEGSSGGGSGSSGEHWGFFTWMVIL